MENKNLLLPVPTIRVVEIWPNGFFLCLLFWWSKSGQGTDNGWPWIFLSFSWGLMNFDSFCPSILIRWKTLLGTYVNVELSMLHLHSQWMRIVHVSFALSMDEIFLNSLLVTTLKKAFNALLLKFSALILSSSQNVGGFVGLVHPTLTANHTF